MQRIFEFWEGKYLSILIVPRLFPLRFWSLVLVSPSWQCTNYRRWLIRSPSYQGNQGLCTFPEYKPADYSVCFVTTSPSLISKPRTLWTVLPYCYLLLGYHVTTHLATFHAETTLLIETLYLVYFVIFHLPTELLQTQSTHV